MLRLIWNLLRFWRAGERRQELQRDLKRTYDTQRAIADYSKDYFLQRDLDQLNAEERHKKP